MTEIPALFDHADQVLGRQLRQYTVNVYRYKAIEANATSSVILYTGKCISPCLEILQLLQVILQPLQDYLQELKDFQTGANAFTSIQNYTGCCISPYSFVPINIYRGAWPLLFRIYSVAKIDINVKVTTWIGHQTITRLYKLRCDLNSIRKWTHLQYGEKEKQGFSTIEQLIWIHRSWSL